MKDHQHPYLKAGYQFPDIPQGFDEIAALYHPGGEVVLDFASMGPKDFAYVEEHDIKIEWPWKEGFKPMPNDWETIGIMPLW